MSELTIVEPEANSCFSLIAQVLSNSGVNSLNKVSIAHILLQLR